MNSASRSNVRLGPDLPPSSRRGEEMRHVCHHSIVAMVGLLAGIVIGCLFAERWKTSASTATDTTPHPRRIESQP